MKTTIRVLALVMYAAAVMAQTTITPGTILPVSLISSLLSSHARPGQPIKAVIMQDVPVAPGFVIHAHTKLLGEITPAVDSKNRGASLSLRFDRLQLKGEQIHITTDLRAIASYMAVYDAQLPLEGPDRGTSPAAWTTVQIGGDVVYRGGGPVVSALGDVGKPAPDGVLVRISSRAGSPCHGQEDSAKQLQALWVFSSDACGVYGLPGVAIRHAGRTAPLGEIILSSSSSKLKLSRGTGLLLRVLPD